MQTIHAEPNAYDVHRSNNIHKEVIKDIDLEIRTTRKCRMKRDHGIGNWWKKRGKQCTDEYESISTRVKNCLNSPVKCEYHSLIPAYTDFAKSHELENGNERTSAKPLESSASASISRSPSSPKSIPRPPPTIKEILDELRKMEPDIEKMNEYVNTCENPNDLYKILDKITRKINSEKALIQRLLPRDISSLNKRDEEYLTKKTELLTKLKNCKDFVSIKFDSIRSRKHDSKVEGGRQQGKRKTRKTKKRGTRRKIRR